ncbi:ABC transporter ATP-binding protein [Sphingomonas sp.]|uniref:ABC transporter ATP-binding protein n=1 Tax=Sphingomonas sp. TaxID=28214 RepID=UPI002B657CFF|nr:ABC transporter ATP-binding protein [Sphingomonas sp.]HWK35489.1 ABC transporter ATP-binding protein [Sphingomonas sp.]
MTRLEIAGLSVGYRGRTVIDGLSLPAISGGGLVTLVGPNGAGKTSLLRALAGLVPAGGQVRLDAIALDRLSLRDRARHVAYMPQTLPQGVALSVLETVVAALLASPASVAVASEADAARLALAQLDAIGALDLAGRRLDELSGGQRQLASLAQALVRGPRVLLLDEPTSALDLRHQHEVMDVARDYARRTGAIVIAVLHDLQAAARISDRVVVLDRGAVAADGAAIDALTPELLARVWKVRGRIERCSHGTLQVMVDGIVG